MRCKSVCICSQFFPVVTHDILPHTHTHTHKEAKIRLQRCARFGGSPSLIFVCPAVSGKSCKCVNRGVGWTDGDFLWELRGPSVKKKKRQKSDEEGKPAGERKENERKELCLVGTSRGVNLTRSALILLLTLVSNTHRMEPSCARLVCLRRPRHGRRWLDSTPPLPPLLFYRYNNAIKK